MRGQNKISNIRVLHCLETVGSGGVEQRRLLLAQGLDPRIFEQRLVCTKAVGGLPPRFEVAGCKVHEVGEFKRIFNFRQYFKTIKIIRCFRPHIIHGAVFEGVTMATVSGRLGRVPIIIGEETSDPVNRRLGGHLLLRLLSSLTHQMVAGSPAVYEYLVNKIRIPPKRTSLIPLAVRERPAPSLDAVRRVRDTYEFSPDDFIIGTVGRLYDEPKRISDQIRAMALIIRSFPNAKLLIVGDGPDKPWLMELARKIGVHDQVFFAGYQFDPSPFYAIMDIFVLTSAWEAFGLVLAEAMFAGLPIVATRVGGIPSIVKDGETGFLVDIRKPEEIANAVLMLYQSPEICKKMGFLGKKRATKKYFGTRYVKDIERFYFKLLKQNGFQLGIVT